MYHKLRFIPIIALLLSVTALASEDSKPEIIFLNPGGSGRVSAFSDNGHWAIQGSSIIDLTKTPFESRNIGGGGRDISDDGKTVVGSNGGPAVWKEGIGWQRLPIPQGTHGGNVLKVTPDGRYAVGVASLSVVNSSEGCMWDLETLSLVELPGRPTEDRAFHTPYPNVYQNQYDNISADGRYVQGTLSWSFMGDQTAYVYDRETQETHYIGFKKNADGTFTPDENVIHYTECEGMSPDGHYVTGPAYILKNGEYLSAYRYDVWNDKFEYYDIDNQPDSWGFSVSNDGLVFLRKPAHSPYSDGYVCYDNFFYSFKDILELGYGINLEKYGIDNTGVPSLCTADGRTIQFINSPSTSYIIRFNEDLKDVCKRLELLSNVSCTPRDGSVMSRVNSIKVDFSYSIEVTPGAINKIELLDSEGNVLSAPLSQGGVYAEGNSLKINFRTRMLEPDKTYSIRIPAGICHVKGLNENVNKEIIIKYIGRKEGPVSIVAITPESGSTVSTIDLQSDPVLVRFDADLKQNTEIKDPILMYIDGYDDPVSYLYAGLYNQNTLALYPPSAISLYNGSVYTIKVPAGLVTDLSGYGDSEAFEISYSGNYIPQLGDEKYLFRSSCDNWDNFLFYEGDHGIPVPEYSEMGFTDSTTPWWVVRDNESSTDMAFASHSCYTDGRQSDDWVVTRQIYIPDDKCYIAFDGQSYRKNKNDILKVYVYAYEGLWNSLNSENVEQIQRQGELVFDEQLDPGPTEMGIDGEWTHYVIPLEAYAGKKIYVAFVNQNQNQSLVMIDNVVVAREFDSFITLLSQSNVVAQEDIAIKGLLVIENEMADYKELEMKLIDGDENIVSTINESGLSLKAGDTYSFEFTDKLPLKIGEENDFTIEFKLDENISESYSGTVRNLTFEPRKRVVLEEFTGRDCQFCPQGHAMIERLGNMFRENFIPIGLYCYNGSDPKGASVMGYWNYLGMTAAPSGRINRRPTTMSLSYSSTLDRYVYTSADIPEGSDEPLWYDEVVSELSEPTYLDINVIQNDTSDGNLSYTAEVRSAIRLENQNIRVFGVLVENNIFDYQINALYDTSDPLLGEWGKGGSLGSSVAQTTFDHAAKATWGRSYNGTANLIPTMLEANEKYKVDMEMAIPESVDVLDNCEFVVMLIDGNSGRIINAASSSDISGVSEMSADDEEKFSVRVNDGNIEILSTGASEVHIYSSAGQLITAGAGEGCYSVSLNGYKGIAIVNVRTPLSAKSFKVIF